MAHSAYILPDGCRPSPAMSVSSVSACLDMPVTSIQAIPLDRVISLFIALYLSISLAISSLSLPDANGVTPQSGIEKTITRLFFIPRSAGTGYNQSGKPWNEMCGGLEIMLTEPAAYRSVEA